MAGTDKRKQSLYFPEEMLKEIQEEANRQDRSLSWVVQQAWKIAREHGWENTFDAEYLAVCMLQADALITIDETLAAKAAHIVPLATLGALVG